MNELPKHVAIDYCTECKTLRFAAYVNREDEIPIRKCCGRPRVVALYQFDRLLRAKGST